MNPISGTQKSAPTSLEQFIQSYGDLIYDLAESILADSTLTQNTLQSILKTLEQTPKNERYVTHERAWVLQVTCQHLIHQHRKLNRQLPPLPKDPQTSPDNHNSNLAFRLQHFRSFFNRLAIEDQLILMLRDKFGISYTEIASALGLPEGSIKIRRHQSLRALEEWIWENT